MPITFRNTPPEFLDSLEDFRSGYEKETRDVEIVYVHDEGRPTELAGYDEAIKPSSENSGKKKTIFLSWYSWRYHFILLSPYFTPDNPHLWNQDRYRHLQLPVSIASLQQAVSELLASGSNSSS